MTLSLSSSRMSRLFGGDCNHVPICLRRLNSARLLWLNQRVMKDDRQFAAFNGDQEAYGRYLLRCCAFEVDSPSRIVADNSEVQRSTGYADRYGGFGIGHNGGSGRGACLNGYQVKGVGRTPLVSGLTNESHASGGAYLEECVRETIFSEVVAAEFPYGAVPTLAIIDTGLIQIWDTPVGQKRERRTLLIRPFFLRPAHFERAVGFVSGVHKEGMQDHARVVQMFTVAAQLYGKLGLHNMFDQFWTNWARQLAYSFVHRLPPGNNTTSNISFDGRLVDFGSMCAVPSWANAATSLFHHPFKDQFDCIERAIQSLSHYFGRHFDTGMAEDHAITGQVRKANKVYQQTVCREVLRLCGVPTSDANVNSISGNGDALWHVASALIAHYQAEQIDMVLSVPELRLPWDLHQVWDVIVPQHLRPMRNLLNNLVPEHMRPAAMYECANRSKSRPALYAPTMKSDIYSALDRGPQPSYAEDVARVSELIDDYVRRSIRMPREA